MLPQCGTIVISSCFELVKCIKGTLSDTDTHRHAHKPVFPSMWGLQHYPSSLCRWKLYCSPLCIQRHIHEWCGRKYRKKNFCVTGSPSIICLYFFIFLWFLYTLMPLVPVPVVFLYQLTKTEHIKVYERPAFQFTIFLIWHLIAVWPVCWTVTSLSTLCNTQRTALKLIPGRQWQLTYINNAVFYQIENGLCITRRTRMHILISWHQPKTPKMQPFFTC